MKGILWLSKYFATLSSVVSSACGPYVEIQYKSNAAARATSICSSTESSFIQCLSKTCCSVNLDGSAYVSWFGSPCRDDCKIQILMAAGWGLKQIPFFGKEGRGWAIFEKMKSNFTGLEGGYTFFPDGFMLCMWGSFRLYSVQTNRRKLRRNLIFPSMIEQVHSRRSSPL